MRVLLPPYKFLRSSRFLVVMIGYFVTRITTFSFLHTQYRLLIAHSTPLFLTLWLNCVSHPSSQVACGTATKVGITK